MPTYEYVCKNCGCKFERFQMMTDEPIKICPECGVVPTRLIGSGMGLIFKGHGFYATDYKKVTSSYMPCSEKEPDPESPAPDCNTCKEKSGCEFNNQA